MEKQYLLLHKIANNLEISEHINENGDGDQTGRFGAKIKELVENIYEELNENFIQEDLSGPFVRAIIRTFSILLNTVINSIKKIKIIIKESAKLVVELWPEQGSLLEGS